MPKRRLGVALLVPPPLAAAVDALRLALGDPALGRIPAHLTLVPPVNVNEERLVDALVVLRQAAAATRPFTIQLGPVTTFHPVNPVLYLEIGGDVDALQRLRDAVFRAPLERNLTWPFVPHVTVADDFHPGRIEGAVAALDSFTAEFVAERVHLLEEGEGRVWTPIADYPFAAPAVVGRGGLPLEMTVTDRLDPEAQSFADTEWLAYDIDKHGDGARAPVPIAVAARRDGDVVGVATGEVLFENLAYLGRLIVRRDVRNEGIGAHLLARFESEAIDRGATRLRLRTEAGGPAERFYRDRGWEKHCRLPDWRAGRDFVQLEKEL